MDQNLARVNRVSLALPSTELAVIARQASARNVTLWDVLTFDRRLSDDAVADSLSVWLNRSASIQSGWLAPSSNSRQPILRPSRRLGSGQRPQWP